jgi:probable rRNA maturation factor
MPRIPSIFEKIRKEVLGNSYDLSVAFLSAEEMRKVTKRTKSVDKVSNVLSFPLSNTSGEILLCKSAAKPYTVEYLFIHGLLHLKGFKHGARMDATEEVLLTQFKLCKKSSQE